MSKQITTQTARCPECHTIIEVFSPASGSLLMCSHCEEILQISSVSPLTLDWGFEEPLPKIGQNNNGHPPINGTAAANTH